MNASGPSKNVQQPKAGGNRIPVASQPQPPTPVQSQAGLRPQPASYLEEEQARYWNRHTGQGSVFKEAARKQEEKNKVLGCWLSSSFADNDCNPDLEHHRVRENRVEGKYRAYFLSHRSPNYTAQLPKGKRFSIALLWSPTKVLLLCRPEPRFQRALVPGSLARACKSSSRRSGLSRRPPRPRLKT